MSIILEAKIGCLDKANSEITLQAEAYFSQNHFLNFYKSISRRKIFF